MKYQRPQNQAIEYLKDMRDWAVSEKQLNIQINDDEIMKRKTGNLGEFCQAIYEQINAPLVEETIKTQQTNFLQRIKQRLIRQK